MPTIPGLPDVNATAIADTDTLVIQAGGVTSEVTVGELRKAIYANEVPNQALPGLAWQTAQAHGADPTGVLNSAPAFQAAADTLTQGGKIHVAGGRYRMDEPVVPHYHGISIVGAGAFTSSGQEKPVHFDFNGLADDECGFDASDVDAFSIQNVYLECTTGVGGAGVRVRAGTNCAAERVDMTWSRGPTSFGIQFGGTTVPEAVTVSIIRNCTVLAGTPFFVGTGSTSVAVQGCYAIGAQGGTAGYRLLECTYVGLLACAADTGLTPAYGYELEGASCVTLDACGAENNAKGFAHVHGGTVGATFTGCRGVGNNTDADTAIGSFLEIGAGTNHGLTVIGCVDTLADGATTASIRGSAGTLSTTLIGYNATAFPDGIGGDASWIAAQLTVIYGGTFETGNLTLKTAVSSIIPGATSFAVKNNADTQNNLIIDDAGNATLRGILQVNGAGNVTGAIQSGGANKAYMGGTAADGSILAGGLFASLTGNTNVNPDGNGIAGKKYVTSYYNQTAFKEAISVGNVASGVSQLDLMKDGGVTTTPAAAATYASLRVPHGTAPSSPVDGDIWTTTAGLFIRINGSTIGPLT